MAVKADLKVQKVDVAAMVEELEARGRELSQRMSPLLRQRLCGRRFMLTFFPGYENIHIQTAQLSNLPPQISSLQDTLVTLHAQQTKTSINPSLALPLPATLDLLSSRQEELDQLNKQLKTLQSSLPRRTRELELLEKELKPLEAQKVSTVAAAREARKRKEEGEKGRGDELELKGRWYRGVDTGLREMLGVQA